MRRRVHPDIVWCVVLGAGVTFEVYALRVDDELTFSRRTRALFHTDTTVGRWAFIAAWTSFAAWFLRHIVRGP